MKNYLSLSPVVAIGIAIVSLSCSKKEDYRAYMKLKGDVEVVSEYSYCALYSARIPEWNDEFVKSLTKGIFGRFVRYTEEDGIVKNGKWFHRDTIWVIGGEYFINHDTESSYPGKKFFFDKDGKLKKVELDNVTPEVADLKPEWTLVETIEVIYDESGDIQNKSDLQPYLEYQFPESRCTFDENGYVIQGSFEPKKEQEQKTFSFKYEFDSNRNWIKKYTYENSMLASLTIRDIKYYGDKVEEVESQKSTETISSDDDVYVREYITSHYFVFQGNNLISKIKFNNDRAGWFGIMTLDLGTCYELYRYETKGRTIQLKWDYSNCSTNGRSASAKFNQDNSISIFFEGSELIFEPL